MIRTQIAAACLATLMIGAVSAQSAEEIVAKHIHAMGGAEKIKAVRSKVFGGRLEAQGAAGTVEAAEKRPNKTRIDVDINGNVITQSYDGQDAWMVLPAAFGGTGLPQDMPSPERTAFIDGADIDGPLVGYREKGHQIAFKGTEEIGGRAAFHLEMTLAGGRVQNFYIAIDDYRLLMTSTRQPGGQAMAETHYSDYREVDGLLMPHGVENRIGGQTVLKLNLDRVEINAEVQDARFVRPPSD